MKYAFETLEIEKHRLLRAIREIRSMPTSGEDYPLDRIKEHMEMIAELDHAIATLQHAIEAAQRQRELEHEKWKDENAKLIAARRESQPTPDVEKPSE